MQTRVDIKQDIRNFVIQRFLFGDASRLSADGSLLGDTIDSMGIVTLVSYLQESFGIQVNDDEVCPSNFDTIDNLVEFVAQKLRN
ncbi:MAG TPA: acyl carrier protein [Terriglobales bacterium]|nr:acyl carrier protein [Terriglobales bacterium]